MVEREGGSQARASLTAFGATVGSAEVLDLGRQANAYLPVLKSFDRFGHREDRVEFHPSYHALMAISVKQGLHGSPWDHLKEGLDAKPKPGAVVARLAGTYMMTQAEAGHGCPITMTKCGWDVAVGPCTSKAGSQATEAGAEALDEEDVAPRR